MSEIDKTDKDTDHASAAATAVATATLDNDDQVLQAVVDSSGEEKSVLEIDTNVDLQPNIIEESKSEENHGMKEEEEEVDIETDKQTDHAVKEEEEEEGEVETNNKNDREEEKKENNGQPDERSESFHSNLGDDVTEDPCISQQTFERDNSVFKSLLFGFRSLKEAREPKRTPLFATEPMEDISSLSAVAHDSATTSTTSDAEHSYTYHYHSATKSMMKVTVNFIDPTTKPANAPVPKASNMLTKGAAAAAQVANPLNVENVYEKLTGIFQRDYGSTLRTVQYTNMRSGESDVIPSIPVETVLARTGAASGNGEAANVAWGGMAGTAMVSDPSEWHNGPFCHVYIAACESMEHYRTKVRPSLQAFVSQLEASTPKSTGAALSSTANSLLGTPVGNANNPSSNAHYLIVYVPTGTGNEGSSTTEETSATTGTVRRALASQFAKARERIANYSQDKELDNNSQHSRDSLGSGDVEFPLDVSDSNQNNNVGASLNLLTQSARALFKKMVTDFATGKVCVLSKSSLESPEGDETAAVLNDPTAILIRSQEWNAFTRMLGIVIVNGFKDRCRRYNEELRRLDSQRAIAAQAAKSPVQTNHKSLLSFKPKPPSTVFNLSYFFLVKESLAFTYEQMQLPAEALLQYDEFRAFLPDLNDKEHKKAVRLRRKSKAGALHEDLGGPPLTQLADAGDIVGFRRRIRSEFEMTAILDVVRRYLFAREIVLLFKMEQPVELLNRCETFCKLMYSVMIRGITDLPPEEQLIKKSEAYQWVIQFTWDVKTTCENYLLSMAETARESFADTFSVDTPMSDLKSETSQMHHLSEQSIALKLSELLEISRLLFKEMGDWELLPNSNNPLRTYDKHFPKDLASPWEPWTALEVGDELEKPTVEVPKFGKQSKTTERQFLLENAFDSPDNYERIYLELAGAIVNLSRNGHRKRVAARLQAEIAEYLVRQGHLRAAAVVFKSTVKIYRWDQWDRCHFWRLFRLAYCQRTTAPPADYLKTLATCFGPRTSAAAPKKALEALQVDLERVVEHPKIGESKYGTIAFLEMAMEVMETSSDESTMGTGVDRKQLLKRYCSVGETVRIQIIVTSHLPNAIELSSLKLFVVDFATFATIIESRESVEEEDTFKIIGLDSVVQIQPGKNSFTFTWEPSTAGQFILSTLEIVWKQGFFYYDSMELPAPLLGVDVLPSEPTHSLSLEPKYLVPGHDQEVRISFNAGSDLVTAGKVQLICSDGISLIGPGEDPGEGEWKGECEIMLGQCKPGEKKVVTVHVRCAMIESFSKEAILPRVSFDAGHGLSAKAFTTYLHAAAETSDYSNTPTMKTVLEAFAPILEKSALSVESVEAVWLVPRERVMISVHLLSNTPDHFALDKWSLHVPSPLKVAKGVDHNADLNQCLLFDGDHLALAFECILSNTNESNAATDPLLQVKLRDDSSKLFTLDLPLNLSEFYSELNDYQSTKRSLNAKASLKLSATEGMVSQPIKLIFTVETQAEGDIVYSIIADECEDWLIGGKVSGGMQRSGFMSLGFMATCEVLGIPAVPGVLTTFPKIELGTVSIKEGYTPLNVHLTLPTSFYSRSRTREVGVAYPTNKILI